jgi:hypothetical protein
MIQPNRTSKTGERCHICGVSLTLQPVYVHGITDMCTWCHTKLYASPPPWVREVPPFCGPWVREYQGADWVWNPDCQRWEPCKEAQK